MNEYFFVCENKTRGFVTAIKAIDKYGAIAKINYLYPKFAIRSLTPLQYERIVNHVANTRG
jgi:hypothetical protein